MVLKMEEGLQMDWEKWRLERKKKEVGGGKAVSRRGRRVTMVACDTAGSFQLWKLRRRREKKKLVLRKKGARGGDHTAQLVFPFFFPNPPLLRLTRTPNLGFV